VGSLGVFRMAGKLLAIYVLKGFYSVETIVSGWETGSFGVLTGAVQCRECCGWLGN
jgi:hypothetical protein